MCWRNIFLWHLHGHVDPRPSHRIHHAQYNHPDLGEGKCKDWLDKIQRFLLLPEMFSIDDICLVKMRKPPFFLLHRPQICFILCFFASPHLHHSLSTPHDWSSDLVKWDIRSGAYGKCAIEYQDLVVKARSWAIRRMFIDNACCCWKWMMAMWHYHSQVGVSPQFGAITLSN